MLSAWRARRSRARRLRISTASKTPVASRLFDRLEHDVALEQLADVGLQLERGQLQEADGLLQLRGHRQLLTQLELQGRFQHGGVGAGPGNPI